MPKLAYRPPKYSLHKPTGMAKVRHEGKTIYLGKHGTAHSLERYAEFVKAFPVKAKPERQRVSPKQARRFTQSVSRKRPEAIAGLDGLQEIAIPEHSCGVYFFCLDGEVVYVGQTVNLLLRLGSHLRDASKQFNQVFFLPCGQRELSSLETRFIVQFQPRYNGSDQYLTRHVKRVEPTQECREAWATLVANAVPII